jgi:hypothetical protein
VKQAMPGLLSLVLSFIARGKFDINMSFISVTRVGSIINASYLYSGGSPFQFGPRYRLSSQRFRWFSSVSQGKYRVSTSN